MDRADFGWLEEALGQPVGDATAAEWGIANGTEIVTLLDGTRVAVQRYRRRADAERRMRILAALREPAAAKAIPIQSIRSADPAAEPPWIAFEELPGTPAAAEVTPASPQFPELAHEMGQLLADFSGLHCPDLELDDSWARPRYLAARADAWAECLAPVLTANQITAIEDVLDDLPDLFEGRPAVLAHGEFVPANVLVEGTKVTGLLELDSVRLADPLFDVAWWGWSVSLAGPEVMTDAWPAFLQGAGMDPADLTLAERVRYLQLIRMLEMLADHDLAPDLWRTVHERLSRTLAAISGD
ncbi:aminoglycoside phosphotransferase family protein [Nocardia sp. CDC159]|uniref:Aminoglycoside phosphotransferase family protein n=1 Tax=Nocardia pulmonis TaxID=2951408 RepID=A0A9X2IY16_9NOCA|nr:MULTISPECIES: aminoglycoside phosphotransferase family protein [Nocardia]MCM6775958.1 aminoglycoside phosphotransferase family protein [Nocardia pulmonis]MCM6788066.1 aminoglycoside phosphotransferase family protein [Nocardia sp. CDC159]